MPFERRTLLASGGAFLLAALAGCGSLSSRSVEGRIVTSEAIERINAFRLSNGQTALRHDRAASAAALEHARTMAENRQMAHNIGLGADFPRRMKRQDVALPAAENIATGQDTVERALRAWEVSASHRRNTLDERFTGVGVAVAYDPNNGGEPYWAMVLSGR
ncbi:CAP domain-containing protein [Pararhizobium haloflavum]|uniref:CAP domain-containing protein n=1 Tax=Pararhizobium haloflavum TaxID=2037914 RepID=UPI0012FFF158|nr:CAP domain-containing protein [Pararhizobium haloflavum]